MFNKYMSDDHNHVWSNIEEEKTKLSCRHKRISPKIINEMTEEKKQQQQFAYIYQMDMIWSNEVEKRRSKVWSIIISICWS